MSKQVKPSNDPRKTYAFQVAVKVRLVIGGSLLFCYVCAEKDGGIDYV
jgi:hypothetical protein